MVQVLQAAGSIIGGVAGNEAGKFNKRAAYAAATEAERDGAAQEARIREAARAAIGQQIAAQGSNGFQQGTGSAIEALAQSQVNATLDALTARREAAAEARQRRVSGDVARAQGKNALIAGMFGAASSAASMRTDWASAKAGQSTGGIPLPYGGVVPNPRVG